MVKVAVSQNNRRDATLRDEWRPDVDPGEASPPSGQPKNTDPLSIIQEGAAQENATQEIPVQANGLSGSTETDRTATTTLSIPGESLRAYLNLAEERLFLTGAQVFVRLLLMQKQRDRQAGLDTAGFISGYRGSPLGGVDLEFLRAKAALDHEKILFQPGLNEDLAATAVWGTQQIGLTGEASHDGVFSLWYAKGPGVDRSGDALRHANLAGTARHGGVLAIAGDDHTAESSSTAHQSEYSFIDAMIPVLAPADVQDLLDFGLLGLAMSRFSGCWVALKCVKEVVQATATIEAGPLRALPLLPCDDQAPPASLNIRAGDGFIAQDARLQTDKQRAVAAFIRANHLDRIVFDGGMAPRIGLVAAGKSYRDLRQALALLGIENAQEAEALGLRLYKPGCVWPLEREGLRAFAAGLDCIIVVEEKRALIETQLRDHLYACTERPAVLGKEDAHGNPLFPASGAFEPADIALAIGGFLLEHGAIGAQHERVARRLDDLRQAHGQLAAIADIGRRVPGFCAGCPHNLSTQVPEGMRAHAGIGCHFMVLGTERAAGGFTHMGAEGASWIGEAPFSQRGHVIQNLGDGTYTHSGLLAVRFAVASGVNITYKILFNDAVAMTGGQVPEGAPTVDRIARQLAAEGVARITIVADEPDKYPPGIDWPEGITIEPRRNLEAVQRRLADIAGVSVLIYDQTCATEKRRRHKRAQAAASEKGPANAGERRVVINELLCEGCGDCGLVSNCVAIQPRETAFGRKRQIDQSACSQDFSCLEASCPALVTVEGVRPRRLASRDEAHFPDLPSPDLPEIGAQPYSILVAGIGGTGVVTIGSLLGLAAHLEGKACGINDMAGLAQKGGAVFSHVRIARDAEAIHSIRIGQGEADLVLGCDLLASATRKVLIAIAKGRTGVLVNDAEVFPGDFARDADYRLPAPECRLALDEAAGGASFVEATKLANLLFGQALAANLFLLGHAWQQGLVPLAEESLLAAIALNGHAVAMNREAFLWGRRAAAFPERLAAFLASSELPAWRDAPETELAPIVALRADYLTAYQNRAYADKYRAFIMRVAAAEAAVMPGETLLTRTVARAYFKLLAVKDEYEVARLYTDGSFQRQLRQSYEGEPRLTFYFSPWYSPWRKGGAERSQRPKKWSFGSPMLPILRLLARLKVLRGTPADPFALLGRHCADRADRHAYETLIKEILPRLTPANHAAAVDLAGLPETIRGFGPVRERSRRLAQAEELRLRQRFAAMEKVEGGADVAVSAALAMTCPAPKTTLAAAE